MMLDLTNDPFPSQTHHMVNVEWLKNKYFDSDFALKEYLTWFAFYRPDFFVDARYDGREKLKNLNLVEDCLKNPGVYWIKSVFSHLDPTNPGIPIPDWNFETELTLDFPRRID